MCSHVLIPQLEELPGALPGGLSTFGVRGRLGPTENSAVLHRICLYRASQYSNVTAEIFLQ